MVPRALALGRDVAPGVTGCSLTELDGAHYRTPAASTDVAFELDQAQYADSAGPCVNAARDRQLYYLADLASEPRFPRFTAAALRAGVRSSLSVPVPARHRPTALNVYSTVGAAFDADGALARADLLARTITALSAHPQAAPTPASDRIGLVEARDSGGRVKAAVEHLMTEGGLSRAAAFDVLTRRSRAQQVSLITLVDDVSTDDEGER
jgi:hypothetical protein